VSRLRDVASWVVGKVARWTGAVGLNYHRIGDGRRSLYDRGLWSATAEGFDAQLRWLKSEFDVIAPRDLPYVVRVKRGRHVLVTFDDGYIDNYTTAFPLLRGHGLPATFFVATGFIDEPRLPWWDEIAWMVRTSRARARLEVPGLPPVELDEPDRETAVRTLLRAYKKLPAPETAAFVDAVARAAGTGRHPALTDGTQPLWMTWDMLREMRTAGMTIGGHTVRHQVLSRMSAPEQRAEIVTCGRRLEEELGVPMRVFSYPVGKPDSFNDDTRACLRELGVKTAFTYYGGFRRLNEWDDHDVPRIAVEQETTLADLRAMVLAPWLAR
jgi:peptidoglycan/xylan/chitin deacetylase (PgdA/CDA1 family)